MSDLNQEMIYVQCIHYSLLQPSNGLSTVAFISRRDQPFFSEFPLPWKIKMIKNDPSCCRHNLMLLTYRRSIFPHPSKLSSEKWKSYKLSKLNTKSLTIKLTPGFPLSTFCHFSFEKSPSFEKAHPGLPNEGTCRNRKKIETQWKIQGAFAKKHLEKSIKHLKGRHLAKCELWKVVRRSSRREKP